MQRRNFLKGMALSAAAAPVLANAKFLSNTKKVTTATHWGALEATIEDGKLIDVEALSFDSNPSLMNKAVRSRTYDETRVLYPYVREGFLKDRHKSDTAMRGKDKFVRVSWKKVNQIIYEEIARCQKNFGPESIYAGSYGWFGIGNLNNPQTLLKRMLNLTGGFVDSKGTYSTGAISVVTPIVMGTNHYFRHTSLDNIAKHTQTLVLIGCDLVRTTQVNWDVPAHKSYDGFVKIQKSVKDGKLKVISINPLRTDSDKFFDARNVKIIPNTDVALMVGMCYHLYETGLYDKNFIERYTVGFDKFKDYFTGKTDGVKKDLAWASKITGISQNEIKELTELMAKTRTMIMPGWSLQRQDHGEMGNWAVFTLAAMLGQIGKNGGGCGASYHGDGNVGSTERVGVSIPGITVGKPMTYNAGTGSDTSSFEQSFSNKAIPVAKISDMLLNPGKSIDYNGTKVEFADIKLIYWAGGNPMHHHQDRNKMLKAWQKPEVIINQDPYWTASSRMADIVLTACTEIERDDISVVGSESKTGLIALKKGIEPVGESKADYDIFADLAAKFGRRDLFTEGRDAKGWAKYFYEQAVEQAVAKGIDLPKFEEFWEKGYCEFTKMEKGGDDYVAFKEFVEDPIENQLGTPSGRIEIFSKKVASYGYDDCEGYAKFYEPAEWLGNATEEFPYHLISPHPRNRLHSQLNNTILRKVYEVAEREPVLLNPENAKQKGIENGDLVIVSSKRGKILCGAVVTDDVRKDVVCVAEGAWYDPQNPGEIGSMCVHGDVNVLTIDKGTSKLAQGNISHTALVNIEKFTGNAPRVKVFSKPNA